MGMGMATRGASPELVRERASRATSPRGGVDSLEDFWPSYVTNNSNGSRRSHGSGVLVPGLG
jgi:hypothetical protein